jgi:hypothetical protein
MLFCLSCLSQNFPFIVLTTESPKLGMVVAPNAGTIEMVAAGLGQPLRFSVCAVAHILTGDA